MATAPSQAMNIPQVPAPTITWDIDKLGSPYPGLFHFTCNHAPAFLDPTRKCGRSWIACACRNDIFSSSVGRPGPVSPRSWPPGVLPHPEQGGPAGRKKNLAFAGLVFWEERQLQPASLLIGWQAPLQCHSRLTPLPSGTNTDTRFMIVAACSPHHAVQGHICAKSHRLKEPSRNVYSGEMQAFIQSMLTPRLPKSSLFVHSY